MKLSNFLQAKKITFNGGRIEIINNIPVDEIEFYDLTADRIKTINSEFVDKLNDNYDKELFLYDILPFISSIERDITFEQFKRLTESPSLEFTYVLEIIIDTVNNLLDLASRSDIIGEKINQIKTKNPLLFNEGETNEEKITRLTKELEIATDGKRKKELFLELADLYDKVENNG